MPEVLVANASPLILLSRVARLDLLVAVGGSVLVPDAVVTEVAAGGDRDGTAAAIKTLDAMTIVPDVPLPASVTAWDLGVGESQVLAVAMARPGTEAVLDDRAARRCAAALGVPVRGTLGIAVLARKRGLIPALQPLLDDLLHNGMRLSQDLRAAALAAVGEGDADRAAPPAPTP